MVSFLLPPDAAVLLPGLILTTSIASIAIYTGAQLTYVTPLIVAMAVGMLFIGFKIINLDCVIGRRSIAIRLPPSILAKLIILKPIETRLSCPRFTRRGFFFPCARSSDLR